MKRVLRSRFDIVAYTARGSRLQWTTRKDRVLTMPEMIASIERVLANLRRIVVADTEAGKAVDVAEALEGVKR